MPWIGNQWVESEYGNQTPMWYGGNVPDRPYALSPGPAPGSLGTQGFSIPNPQYQQQSPVGAAIGQQRPQMSPYGGYVSNYNFPGQGQTPTPTGPGGFYGQPMPPGGVDPQYWQYLAQSGLQGQQYAQGQAGIAEAIGRIGPFMREAGLPYGPGETEKFAERTAALETEPIRREKESALRTIGEETSRRGSALGVNRDRMISEALGSAAMATRATSVGAQLDYVNKLANMVSAFLGGLRPRG